MGTNNPQHHTDSAPSLDQVIQAWDSDIQRAAKARGMSYDATQDLVQAARIRLAEALARNPHLSKPYLRRVIANAMHDEFRGKRIIDDPVPTVRENWDEQDQLGEPEVVDETPLASETFYDAQYVRRWKSTLSVRERNIADLVWGRDVSERDAAAKLGISKTRLHQLKDEIIRRARNDLIALAV